MWFGLVVLCSLKRGKKSSLTQFESTHHSLNQLNKVFAFMWIDSHLFESIHIYWIDSHLLNWFMYASCLFYFESSHKTLWLVLIRFIWSLNRINLHPGYTWIYSDMIWIVSSFILFWSVFLLSESIQAFSESIQFVTFMQKLSLFTPHYIYTPPLFQIHWIICIYSL